ncbi:hepcidin-2-like [Bombina bombina]|uniref:hepcidin-2-like n=1 Tax=Bombina bombina TaxID=8345 RepID=UPI00235AD54B|nr:hepcidin-2-like [Bombina bombina]
MKSAVLCSLVILTIICHLSFSVLSDGGNTNLQNLEGGMDESNLLTTLLRTKRQSHLSICRYCCNCCKNKGCGLCCRT